MAAVEAAFSKFSSSPSISPKFSLHPRPLSSIKLPISISTIPFSFKSPLYPLPPRLINTKKSRFQICSVVEEAVAVEEKTEPPKETFQKRKLFVLNLPWSLSVTDIRNLFAECGTVTDVEVLFTPTLFLSTVIYMFLCGMCVNEVILKCWFRFFFGDKFAKEVILISWFFFFGMNLLKMWFWVMGFVSLGWICQIIKQKDGKNRGFAFVTMASGEEAQAAIAKFDSYVSCFGI